MSSNSCKKIYFFDGTTTALTPAGKSCEASLCSFSQPVMLNVIRQYIIIAHWQMSQSQASKCVIKKLVRH